VPLGYSQLGFIFCICCVIVGCVFYAAVVVFFTQRVSSSERRLGFQQILISGLRGPMSKPTQPCHDQYNVCNIPCSQAEEGQQTVRRWRRVDFLLACILPNAGYYWEAIRLQEAEGEYIRLSSNSAREEGEKCSRFMQQAAWILLSCPTPARWLTLACSRPRRQAAAQGTGAG
jgi:hypothetical protein